LDTLTLRLIEFISLFFQWPEKRAKVKIFLYIYINLVRTTSGYLAAGITVTSKYFLYNLSNSPVMLGLLHLPQNSPQSPFHQLAKLMTLTHRGTYMWNDKKSQEKNQMKENAIFEIIKYEGQHFFWATSRGRFSHATEI